MDIPAANSVVRQATHAHTRKCRLCRCMADQGPPLGPHPTRMYPAGVKSQRNFSNCSMIWLFRAAGLVRTPVTHAFECPTLGHSTVTVEPSAPLNVTMALPSTRTSLRKFTWSLQNESAAYTRVVDALPPRFWVAGLLLLSCTPSKLELIRCSAGTTMPCGENAKRVQDSAARTVLRGIKCTCYWYTDVQQTFKLWSGNSSSQTQQCWVGDQARDHFFPLPSSPSRPAVLSGKLLSGAHPTNATESLLFRSTVLGYFHSVLAAR